MTRKLRRDVKLKDGRTFSKGESFHVAFVATPEGVPYLEAVPVIGGIHFKSKRFENFFAPPSMQSLEEWVSDGICETVTGDNTEPDGFGPDGAPSWLLALGMI